MDNLVDIPSSLFLSTGEIDGTHTTTSVSNNIGGWVNGRQNFWFNVKLRQAIGTNIYDKYDKFIISVSHVYLINSAANASEMQLQLQMGGLNWVNSSYDQTTQGNNYWTVITNVVQGTGAFAANILSFDTLSNSFVFRKGDPDVKLEFRYMNFLTNQIQSTPSSGLFPSCGIIFKIQAVKE
jgi:hypothetical protein